MYYILYSTIYLLMYYQCSTQTAENSNRIFKFDIFYFIVEKLGFELTFLG